MSVWCLNLYTKSVSFQISIISYGISHVGVHETYRNMSTGFFVIAYNEEHWIRI
jgi:hypothetical protein